MARPRVSSKPHLQTVDLDGAYAARIENRLRFHPAAGGATDGCARFEALAVAVGDGVCEIDATGRLTYVSRSAATLVGAAAEELLGRSLHEVVHPADVVDFPHRPEDCPFARIVRGDVRRQEDRFWVHACAPKVIELSGAAIRVGRRSVGAVLTFRDVTEREHRARLRADYLAFASHEIRSPLSVIMGMTEWLKGNLDRNLLHLDRKVRDAIDTLTSESVRLDRIVEVFLDDTSLESGLLAAHSGAIDLVPILEEEGAAAQRRHPGTQVRVHVPEVAVEACASPGQLRVVLANLLNNAAKYAGEHAMISLRLGSNHASAYIDVVDDGPGIPAEDQKHIFERHYRTHAAAATGAPGLGLGLFVTRHIVELLGGTISVSSAGGRGTRFRVELPLAAGAVADASQRSAMVHDIGA